MQVRSSGAGVGGVGGEAPGSTPKEGHGLKFDELYFGDMFIHNPGVTGFHLFLQKGRCVIL